MNESVALRNYAALDHAAALLDDLNKWLSDTPAITTEDAYREGARLSKLAGNCLRDVDDERKAELKPLSDRVGQINGRYKARTAPLRELLDVLSERLTAYAKAEEARRRQEAEARRKAAEEAAERAREAAAAAGEAQADAAAGVVGVDVLTTTKAVHDASAAAALAEREARRAERDTTFRVRTGYGNATSMRNKEELLLVDPVEAIAALGITERIKAAILTDAREWRKHKGELPPGVVSHTIRSL